MRGIFQISLHSLLVVSALVSLILAASAGAFGEVIQLMVFGTAAYMLVALGLIGIYSVIALATLSPLMLLFWLMERRRGN